MDPDDGRRTWRDGAKLRATYKCVRPTEKPEHIDNRIQKAIEDRPQSYHARCQSHE